MLIDNHVDDICSWIVHVRSEPVPGLIMVKQHADTLAMVDTADRLGKNV